MFGHFTTLCMNGLTTLYHDLWSGTFIAVSLKFILHPKSEIPVCTPTTSQNRCKRQRLITRVKEYARTIVRKKIVIANFGFKSLKEYFLWIFCTRKASNSCFKITLGKYVVSYHCFSSFISYQYYFFAMKPGTIRAD